METTSKKSVFETLNEINCNEHTESKNGLTYLSWAWAWQIVKKNYPEATSKVYENEKGWNYFTDGRTCWVKTGVTIEGVEQTETLPVMDFRNNSIPADKVTSFDVNKAIKRCVTKNLSLFGLGLYIYAGNDLPDVADDTKREEVKVTKKAEKFSEDIYWKMVKAHGEGRLTKAGGSYLDKIKEVGDPDYTTQFLLDVDDYKASKEF